MSNLIRTHRGCDKMLLSIIAGTLFYVVMLAQVVTGYVSCSFEHSADATCGFYNNGSNNVDWVLKTGNVQDSFTRPMVDHTQLNNAGHYITTESSFPIKQGTERVSCFLTPTVVMPPNGNASDFCLKFCYHMYGPPSQSLRVYVREHGQDVPRYSHWSKAGNLGDVWHEMAINISITAGFQIAFEGRTSSAYHGDISLDDIEVTPRTCTPANTSAAPTSSSIAPTTALNQFNCNLNNINVCGFTRHPRNAFDWKWSGNITQTSIWGPLGDHTLGSSSGFYFFVTSDTTNQQTEQRSRIVSPAFARNTAHKCLRFYLYMNGNNVGRLNAYVVREGYTPPLDPTWSINKTSGNIWKRVFMDITPQQSNFRVIFEAVRGKNFDGSIAVDDLEFSDHICPTVNATNDFESGIGDFMQDSTDEKNWYLKRGRTPSYYTGPDTDHTKKNSSGQFLYIETSSYARNTGHVARLYSPVLLATTQLPRCLTFWYHMFGKDIESLTVYMVNASNPYTTNKTELWTMSGNRGNRWKGAEVHLKSSVDFQVVFEAEQSDGYQGDIAIDDITIEADVCPGEHHFHNYSSISCDFEEFEMCYYEQEKTADDIDWMQINGDFSAQRVQTGPSTDHTKQNELGFYLFVGYENINGYQQYNFQNKKARIMSPYASPQKRSSCLEFWYHMYGRNAESLKVFIQKEGEEVPTAHAWKKSGDHGNFWHRAAVDIDVINTRFRVVFEAITGNTHQNDIAIDDVTFHNSSSCPPFVTESPPAITLPPTTHNASCSFEDPNMCGYTQVINDNLDWSRRSGKRIMYYSYYSSYSRGYVRSAATGPNNDHTLGTGSGYYMNFDCHYNRRAKFDYRAQLATPYVEAHSEPRCMHFYYHMFGRNVDYLQLYLVPFGYTLSIDPQWILYSNQGNQWQHGTLDIPPMTDPYRVFFEASRGISGSLCDISIDDVIFVEGACPKDPEPTPVSLTAGSCDFEPTDDHLCGYVQAPGYANPEELRDAWGSSRIVDNFDWSLNTGNTSSDKTGPSADSTLGTAQGHYMYIESSLPNRPRKSTKLLSPVIEFSTQENMCLQFAYHMKGEGIGTLNVYQKTKSGSRVLKQLMGHQGDDWQITTVDLEQLTLGGPSLRPQFQLMFEAIVGGTPNGDIAIDDILVLRQPCGGHQKESLCTFDLAGDWCGYQQRFEDNDLQWKWHDVAKPRSPIEIAGDGSYIYLTSVGHTETKVAMLSSHTIDGSPHQWHDHCVEFDYFLPQNSTGTKITIAVAKHEYEYDTVWSLVADKHKNGWKHFRKTLSFAMTKDNFKVLFIGILGRDFDVIGLDNPTISLGSCEPAKPNNTLQTNATIIEYKSDPVAVFFGILSAFLIIVLVACAVWHLHRKYKGKFEFPALSVRYLYHQNEDKVRFNQGGDNNCNLTIENPLYGAAPAVISTNVTLKQNGTGQFHSDADIKQSH